MLVDLAGNENLEQSGAKGDQALEAKAINLSIIQLQQVLRDLAAGKSSTFRGSKLTLMLKAAYQANKKPKMLMLAHISLDPKYYSQTKATLQFAHEVMAGDQRTKPANVNPTQADALNSNHPPQAASGRPTVETRPSAETRRGIPTGRQRAGNNPIAGAQNVQPPSTGPVIDPLAPHGGARGKVPQTTNTRGGRK